MAFGSKGKGAARMSSARLASMGGGAATASAGGPARRVSVEPDLSRIKRRQPNETPEERKRRLAAKTVNFTATFIARIVIMVGLAFYGYNIYETTGVVPRGLAAGFVAMIVDFGRVVIKCSEPGTK